MADISKILASNGTTYNIKDTTARSTFAQYRRLDDPNYDEIYVTELNSGNIINTGAARFLNTINGSISGNAATASDSAKLNGYASDTAASNNTIARRTANGYIFATYFNQSSGAETPTSSSYIIYANSDGYFRKSTVANMKTAMSLNNVENKSSATIRGEITSANVTTALGYTPVNKAGDTMSGTLTFSTTNGIAYQGTKATYSMIRFKDNTNDAWGNGIVIGGGGLTVVGSGESADTVAAQHNSGDEVLELVSDGTVYIRTQVQDGFANAKTFTFSTDGSLTATKFIGPLQGNADTATSATTATQDSDGNTISSTYVKVTGDPTIFKASDIAEGAANLSTQATAHRVTVYRNGMTIPYQMDNANDGGMIRVRGTSENDCIFELGTWDDSGAGETIQFNYYPTTSQVTPTYSVVVPKKSGTIMLTNDTYSGTLTKAQVTTALGYTPPTSDTNYYHTTGSWSGLTYTATANGGAGALAFTIPTGTSATTVAVGNHNHDGSYSKIHAKSWDFTTTKPLSSYVTFDQSSPTGAPKTAWFNGFVSSHSDYLASYILNEHRTANWYVGYGQFDTSTSSATAPTWYLLLHSSNYTDYTVKKDGTGASGTWGISISGNANTATSATKATQDSDGNTIKSTYLKLAGGTMTGQIVLASTGYKTHSTSGYVVDQYGNFKHQSTNTGEYWVISNNAGTAKLSVYWETGKVVAANDVQSATVLCANTANSSTAGGLSLYGTEPQTYGVIFRGTGNQGKHGYVQSDWATYFTMNNQDSRGWVFRRQSSGNVASIDTKGQMVLNGSLTLGGNSTNTSGVRQVYNATTQSLDFVFVA